MRIAVVGAGVAGLTAAHYLGKTHAVTLFEADARLGGHANTVEVDEGARKVAVDTGFLVFNTRTYPRFVGLLEELGVGWAPSDMSFSVRSETRDFEYGGRDLGTLYVQRRHLASPRFHRMVWDIARFYREARELVSDGDEVPLGAWLERRRYSRQFIDDYLFPMLRAVWSARRDVALDFPARFLARFFENHGFLSLAPGRWLTLPGGSRTYVGELERRFTGVIRRGARVTRVEREAACARVTVAGHAPEPFDHVVLACHADQALAVLADPSPLERELLSAFPYQPNRAVLHTDTRVMPRRRRTWSSWNVHLDDAGCDGACVTYWINALQPLATRVNYFVTLNPAAPIDPARVLARFDYAHPVFGVASTRAQARHAELLGPRKTSFCGAYWRNGFHEDGVVSALRVCERLGAAPVLGAAA
ncbi:MAG TPA: FAD-dependent oxidoreductase [Polyangiaceae bacterium]|nr:FAD-dependent oxidoreductase [Polyangiaceae bacterium]